jgi:PII-like signaling protein
MTIRLKDNEKNVQEIPIIILKGETVQTIAHFFDINQKITNKTRIFMHFVPRNR